MIPKYMTLNGEVVDGNNLNRGVWYSAGCQYWTDDWSKLRVIRDGIPRCPKCGAVGFQAIWKEWMEGAEKFAAENPGYLEFLEFNKEKCNRGQGDFLKAFERWKENRDGSK